MKKEEFPDNAKITCRHVLYEGVMPEYLKADDCYTCSDCRDRYAQDPKAIMEGHDLIVVHSDCLQPVVLKFGLVVK